MYSSDEDDSDISYDSYSSYDSSSPPPSPPSRKTKIIEPNTIEPQGPVEYEGPIITFNGDEFAKTLRFYKTNIENIEISTKEFWQKINSLEWSDKSDLIIPIAGIKKRLQKLKTESNFDKIQEKIEEFTEIIDEKLTELKVYDKYNLNDIEKKNLLYHIVCKGSQFYHFVNDSPSVAEYLLEQNEYLDASSLFDFNN